MVFAEMEGEVYVAPVPSNAPPVEAAYQLIVPAEVIAARLTVPVPQRLAGVVPEMAGIVLTVATTAVREVVVHPLAVAST